MNHSTLLQSPFHLNGHINTDSDYSGTQRHFSGPAAFSMDDEENNRRSGAVVNPLVQPVSIPASNGLRYNTQQPAMQDVPFATSPTILMSPSDSCSETFSPASGSLYSHSPGLSYDRMPDFRSHRVPPLQPPAGVSSTMQSPGNASLMGRNDSYPGYAIHRGNTFPPLASLSDTISRVSPYTSTPRALDCGIDRSQNIMFGQNGTMLVDPVPRLPQPVADAPPFHETEILQPVISGSQTIKPEIQAKIHKGFFQVDEKWTCYRRNYFSVSCSFSLHPWTHAPLYLKCSDQSTERILAFSMSISAIVNAQYGEIRELVQHTPKRDKQSERKPGKIILQPCQPPPMVLSHGSTSHGGQHGFSLASQSAGLPMEYGSSYASQPPSQPPTQHTFERIQFQKATANNGKRRAQQQYYNLVVELYAEIANPMGGAETQWFRIARRLSHPMVVRGRSPGHYKDGRRDSSTSMGPDGGSGGSGDGSGGAVLPPGLGQAARSHLTLMSYDSTQRGGPHYGRNDYHQMAPAGQSPLSESPHISSSSSSAFDISMMSDSMDPMDSMKSTSGIESYPDAHFGMVDGRKESHFRNHLPPFEYDPVPKSEDTGNGFPEPYDPMVSMISNEQHPESLHYLKQHPPRMTSQIYHSSPSGYDSVYSARSGGGSSPYSRPQNSQSLCA